MSDIPAMLGIMSVNVYVDDFDKAIAFYRDVLGMEKGGEMGDQSCFFHLAGNKHGLFLDGGYTRSEIAEKSSRAAFTFHVDSAQKLFERVKESGAQTLQPQPQDMGRGYFWFQFRDPAGNIIEAISGPA
ncbi:MAG: VOC family protein [Tepidisphaeraceae bacterium]